MVDPRIELKSRYFAGLLAFLVPGAGHWYQGRRFKATIYSVCILTIFVWGMILGNLQPVYSQVAFSATPVSVQMEIDRPRTSFAFGYLAQVFVGLPALPALIQQERFRLDSGKVEFLEAPLESEFVGVVRERDRERLSVARKVRGTVRIEPVNKDGSSRVTGQFVGTFENGDAVELVLGGDIVLGRGVFGSPQRDFVCSVMEPDNPQIALGALEGSVSRSFINWFQAPRDNIELDRLHGELSRGFDLASVFTWIAGLLNVLAIWDAVDGPAYGYGDEKPEDDDGGGKDKTRPPDPAPAK